MLRTAITLFLLCAAAPSVLAQTPVPFPLLGQGPGPHPDVRALQLDPSAVAELGQADWIRLTQVPTARGADVELILRRLDLERLRFGWQVDGVRTPGLLEAAELSVWTGTVAGREGSEAVLAFSNRGVRGWWHDGIELTHLLAQPDERGDWSRPRAWMVGERELRALTPGSEFRCATATGGSPQLPPRQTAAPQLPGLPASAAEGSGCALWECAMAIETDYQLHQVFGGDLIAQAAHVGALLAASSARYEEQIDTVLTYPYVQFYTNPNDPWNAQDFGGNSIDVLLEFANAWSGNLPPGTVLGHFLSGASLGGGVAYLSGICDTAQQFSFAVSGNLDGLTPFPIAAGPFNWEFIVFTHETGHSFGSPHTHDYSPPIDTCASGGSGCISTGTVMSYCHLCPGGMSNMTTFFHPTVVQVMKNGAANCLPLFVGVDAEVLTLIAPDQPTAVAATVTGIPTSFVQLAWRSNSQGAFQSVAMVDQGNGVWLGQLPPFPCGSAPEYFVTFNDASCGQVLGDTAAPTVGVEQVYFADDFEQDTGWVVGAPDDTASTGIWERVTPIGTSAQPSQDVSAGGTVCFVTGQHPGGGAGANDIDGGKTTLRSPVIDLDGKDATISYWRWFSNNGGANPGQEVFTVSISNNSGASWTPVEVVGPTGPESSGGWYFHEFRVSDFVTPTAQVVVRFVAKDDVGALIEAALDEFRVREINCDLCQPDLGFGGPGTLSLSLCGDPLVAGQSAALRIVGAPAGAPLWLLGSFSFSPTPLVVGTMVTNPIDLALTAAANGAGEWVLPNVPGGAPFPVTLYLQGAALDLSVPGFLAISNAIGAQFQ